MRMMSKIGLAAAGTAMAAGAAVGVARAVHPRPTFVEVAAAGETAPIAPGPTALVRVAMPGQTDDPLFADLDRSLAEMDARMAAMMQRARNGQSGGAPGMAVSINGMPAGSVSYSYSSTSSGANGCTQTVEMSSTGSAKPRIVRTSSGDCGTEAPDTSAATKMVSAPPAQPAPAPKRDRRDTI